MTNGQLEEYLRNRFSKIRDYYDARATRNQTCYRICALYILISSVALSLLLSLDIAYGGAFRVAALVLAPTIAIVSGVASHYRFHENWLSYRAAWDALLHEQYLHGASAGPYRTADDQDALFVERTEQVIGQEGAGWFARHTRLKSEHAVGWTGDDSAGTD